jgi:hypothetical protein
MDNDRRAAPRYVIPADVTAEVGGITVRLIDLSVNGAKVEHSERFTLAAPKLSITWHGVTISVTVRAARSEITGRRGSTLIYQTGLSFVSSDASANDAIAAFLVASNAPPVPTRATAQTPVPDLDDSWVRQIGLLRQDPDEQLPYAQFRLTGSGWQKDYVSSAAQPADGFTIRRERHDFDEMQRTFEAADADTRRMMHIALESELAQKD